MMRTHVITFALFAMMLALFAGAGAIVIIRYVVGPIVGIGQ